MRLHLEFVIVGKAFTNPGGGGPTSTSIYDGSSYDCLYPIKESQLLNL